MKELIIITGEALPIEQEGDSRYRGIKISREDLMRQLGIQALAAGIVNFSDLVRSELDKARVKNAPMNSAHEGYAVIAEELDEFWDEVKKRRSQHDPVRMLAELVQVAAMCQRTAEDLGFLNPRQEEE